MFEFRGLVTDSHPLSATTCQSAIFRMVGGSYLNLLELSRNSSAQLTTVPTGKPNLLSLSTTELVETSLVGHNHLQITLKSTQLKK